MGLSCNITQSLEFVKCIKMQRTPKNRVKHISAGTTVRGFVPRLVGGMLFSGTVPPDNCFHLNKNNYNTVLVCHH